MPITSTSPASLSTSLLAVASERENALVSSINVEHALAVFSLLLTGSPFDAISDHPLDTAMFSALLQTLPADAITSSAGVWLDKDVPMDFQAELDALRGIVGPVPATPEATARAINEWVTAATDGRIERICEPAEMTDIAIAVVSALTMRATWAKPFETMDEPFSFDAPSKIVRAHGMRLATKAQYEVANGVTRLLLPYEQETLTMELLLPDEGVSPKQALLIPRGRSTRGKVDVRMPRFAFESETDLLGALPALGQRLTGTDGSEIAVGSARQRCRVEVDEQGTKAEAVAAVFALRGVSRPEPPLEIVLDRPFAFRLLSDQTPLFEGWVVDPS